MPTREELAERLLDETLALHVEFVRAYECGDHARADALRVDLDALKLEALNAMTKNGAIKHRRR